MQDYEVHAMVCYKASIHCSNRNNDNNTIAATSQLVVFPSVAAWDEFVKRNEHTVYVREIELFRVPKAMS